MQFFILHNQRPDYFEICNYHKLHCSIIYMYLLRSYTYKQMSSLIYNSSLAYFTAKGSCAGISCYNDGFCDGSSPSSKCLCRSGFSDYNCFNGFFLSIFKFYFCKYVVKVYQNLDLVVDLQTKIFLNAVSRQSHLDDHLFSFLLFLL